MRVTSKASYAIPEDFQTLSRLNMVVYELRPCISDFLALVVPVWYVPELSRFCNVKSEKRDASSLNLGRSNDTNNYSSSKLHDFSAVSETRPLVVKFSS
jgi:predicted amidohydrolase